MKKILISLALCTAFTAYTQTSSRKTIATESTFKVYESIIDSDTMVYYYFSFQNQKYQHITGWYKEPHAVIIATIYTIGGALFETLKPER